jgi:alkyl hydroperoxide reductase subunit AhpC
VSFFTLLQDDGIALRGLFLIDPKGTLRQITINDLPVGRSVEETIRLVKAFQFVSWGRGGLQKDSVVHSTHSESPLTSLSPQTDEHGEVCPANWDSEKNNATIK